MGADRRTGKWPSKDVVATEAIFASTCALVVNGEWSNDAGGRGETSSRKHGGRPNGLEVNPRGQGPRGHGSAARRMPALEARDAGGVTPRKLR